MYVCRYRYKMYIFLFVASSPVCVAPGSGCVFSYKILCTLGWARAYEDE